MNGMLDVDGKVIFRDGNDGMDDIGFARIRLWPMSGYCAPIRSSISPKSRNHRQSRYWSKQPCIRGTMKKGFDIKGSVTFHTIGGLVTEKFTWIDLSPLAMARYIPLRPSGNYTWHSAEKIR